MSEYQRLETKITSYLKRNNIKSTQNIISFYDLYKALENKFSELKEVQVNSKLIEKINKDNTIVKRTGKIFKETEVIYTKILDNILATTSNNTSKITFFYGVGSHPETFTILKDFDDNDIYFDKDTTPNKPFITKYYDDIMFIFHTLESFSEIMKIDIGLTSENDKLKPIVFTDGFLTLKINYDVYGNVNTNISINSKEDTTGIYQREWFTRKKLSELVSENNDEILKKIPINVKDLDVKYQDLVTEYKSNNLNG